MSAYALPGLFFFPSVPAEEANLVGDVGKGSEYFTSNANDVGSDALAQKNAKEATIDDSWSNTNGLLISIKSAKVDHIQLIQGFTAPTSNTSGRKNSFRAKVASLSNSLTGFSHASNNTDASDEQWGEYDDSPSNSPTKKNVQFNFNELDDADNTNEMLTCPSVSGRNGVGTLNNTSEQSNEHDNAIQFTLTISFNGRKYTATRALPSFVKLRHDLMLELQGQPTKRFNRPGVLYTLETNKNSAGRILSYESKEGDVIIPELPIGGDSKVKGIVRMAGRGFRGLQDTVCGYCPIMEKWIQSVADLVPSSPSLANFLWEPIHSEARESCNSSPNLLPMKSSLYGSKSSLRGVSNSSPNLLPTKSSPYGSKSSLRGGSVQALNSICESEDTDSESDSDSEDILF